MKSIERKEYGKRKWSGGGGNLFINAEIEGLKKENQILKSEIAALVTNTSLVKTFDFGAHDSTVENVDTVMYYILNQAMPLDGTGKLTYICTFTVGAIYRAIIQPYSSREYASAIVFSYRLPQIIYYQKWAGVLTKYTAKWEGQVI